LGFSVLRFNFRGVGRSQGSFEDGPGELSDATMALDWLQTMNPDAKQCWIAGYSFGAWIALQLLMRRPDINNFIAVSPPANEKDFSFLAPCPASGLIVQGGIDEIDNPVMVEKGAADHKGKKHHRHHKKEGKKHRHHKRGAKAAAAAPEMVPVMETVQAERIDTVMVDEPVMKTDPKLASGLSQFFSYIGKVFHGDLGLSYQNNEPVTNVIKKSLPWTLAIQAPTILLGWIVGNLLGAFAAYKRGIFDKVFFPCAMFLNGVPFFVFGMLLVAFFSITLGWFPAMGAYSPDIPELTFSWACIKSVSWYYVLPFFSVFPILLSGQATGMRSMSIYELGTDYMKYAKWLGLREGKIISYVFRNAMLPQLTGLAQSLGAMVGGALITEMIFSYPGLGMAMLNAIQKNDYATIQGCTLMISTCVLVANFAVDVLIAVFDPRVKAGLQMGGK
jgi:ABC-type dipeptide/oligopeptide/nickel transport system permease component